MKVLTFGDFAEACIEASNNHEAAKYVHSMTDSDHKAELFIRLGLWSDASNAAFAVRDVTSLYHIRDRCKASRNPPQPSKPCH